MDHYSDELIIKWHIDDVKSLDKTLTDQQARMVLHLADRNHDATIGINWDVLQMWIDEVKTSDEVRSSASL